MTRPSHDQPPRQLHLVAWNAKVGRKPRTVVRDLSAFLDENGWPDVIVLCEAGRYTTELRRRLSSRYRVLRAGREHDGIVMLVDRSVPIPTRSLLVMRLGWIGPKAFRRHPGRTFPVVDLGKGKSQLRWRIVGIHRTPGGPSGGVLTRGRNRPAWEEEHARLLRLAARTRSHRRVLVMVGDQNCEMSDRRPTSVGGLAEAIGARVIRTGAKVDWAILRGGGGSGHRGPNLGSDHPLIRYQFTHHYVSD